MEAGQFILSLQLRHWWVWADFCSVAFVTMELGKGCRFYSLDLVALLLQSKGKNCLKPVMEALLLWSAPAWITLETCPFIVNGTCSWNLFPQMLNRYKASDNEIYNYRETSLLLFVLCSLFVLSPLYRSIWKRINRKKSSHGGRQKEIMRHSKKKCCFHVCHFHHDNTSSQFIICLLVYKSVTVLARSAGLTHRPWADSTDNVPAAFLGPVPGAEWDTPWSSPGVRCSNSVQEV